MSISRYWLLILICMSCAHLREKVTTDPLEISDIRVVNQSFDLNEVEQDTIAFVLSKKAEVKIQIWNCEGYLVRNLFEGKAKKGMNYLAWNGEDDAGEAASDGDYYFTITAFTGKERVMYDPYELLWGDIITPSNFIVSVSDQKIYYNLPLPSLVRIRAGRLREALLYATIVNWEPRSQGPNVEIWDGYDNSRLFDVIHQNGIEYSVDAYALAENVIIVKNGGSHSKSYSIKRELPLPNSSSQHSLHLRSECRDPEPSISVIGVKDYKSGIPVIKKEANLKVNLLNDSDERFMENERFEIMFYVDGEFYFEEENGYFPYKHKFDISELPEGEHILTVVLASSGDHAGSSSIQFFVEKRRCKCPKK